MFQYGTSIRRLCCMVLATFYAVNFVSVSDAFFEKGFFASGNTLWDELYQKCGNRVSFYCVQNRLMNYINTTLDADLRITDGIHFVKSNRINRMIDYDSDFEFATNSSTLSRTVRASKSLSSISDNEISPNATEEKALREDDEEEFSNFVKTVEKIEDDLETTEKSNLATPPINATSWQNGTIEHEEDEEPRSNNFVIKSLNKVGDILYEKTSAYLSTHDLRLDLPQTFFGGSRMVVSPRGFDEDGGILLKVNFNQVETPRHIGKKYFRKYLSHML